MNSYELSRAWFDFAFENPEKISPNHSAIYFFAIEHCNRLGWKTKFGFPTQMAMDAIGIKKHQTYIRYFNDLVEWGFFVLVQKSANQYSSNIISLISAMPKNGKAMDKANIIHAAKQIETNGQSTGQSNSSIDKQINNKPINLINKETTNKLSSGFKKPVHKSYGYVKDYFLKFYLEKNKTEYYFKSLDGKKINSLITQLTFKIKTTYPNVTEDELPKKINEGFEYLLKNINDKWILDHLSLSNIDSKFNEIVSQIINPKQNGKPKGNNDEFLKAIYDEYNASKSK